MKRLMLLVTMLAVLGAGCASSGDSAAEPPMSGGDAVSSDTDDGGQARTEEPGDEGFDDVGSGDRQVIRTGRIEIEVEDTRAAMESIESLVRSGGGYVSSSIVQPVEDEGDQPRISLTVRVPAEGLDSTLASVRMLATEVVSETVTSTDVTEEYVDLEARISNLEVLEEELRALLAEVRARGDADPDDLLQVFNEISSVRGQIEQLEGRRRLLADQVQLSTLTIELVPVAPEIEIVEDGWEPGHTAREALRSLVDALQGLGNAAITAILFLLPIALLIVVPVALVAWLVARALRRRGQRSESAAETSDEA
jgi:hypothetical protein